MKNEIKLALIIAPSVILAVSWIVGSIAAILIKSVTIFFILALLTLILMVGIIETIERNK